MRDVVADYRDARVSAPSRSAGGRSAGAATPSSTRPSCGRPARRPAPTTKLFVDAGRQRRVLAARAQMGDAHRRDAEGLRRRLVRGGRCVPDAIDDFCHLRRASPVPIAGGEVLTRRQSFMPWLTRGAFDIVQPDVTKVGGISEQRRIAWMAQDFGVQICRPWLEHGARRRGRSAARRCAARTSISSSSSAAAPMSTASWRSPSSSMREAICRFPKSPASASPIDRDKLGALHAGPGAAVRDLKDRSTLGESVAAALDELRRAFSSNYLR